MPLRTPKSSDSSRECDPPFILEAGVSRLLWTQWAVLHVLGVVSAALAWPAAAYFRAACIVVLLLSAACCRPAQPPGLVRNPDGRWSVPAWRRYGLSLAPETRFTGWWARLVLRGPDGTKVAVLLLRDQLPGPTWWAFQAGLRTQSWRLCRAPPTQRC